MRRARQSGGEAPGEGKILYANSGDILSDMRRIIEASRESAYQAVNFALVQRNWPAS